MSIQEEDFDEPAISEYTAKYCWHRPASFPVKEDKYEVLVSQKMNDDYQSSTVSKQEEPVDEYELLVQQKMAEQPQQSEKTEETVQIEEEDEKEAKDVEEKVAPKKKAAEKKSKPEKKAPKTVQKVQPVEKRQRKTAKNDRLYGRLNNAKKSEEKPDPRRERSDPRRERSQKKSKGSNFLSSGANNAIKPKVTVYKPKFYSHPEEAPAEERNDLHGPFWVYWPKDEVIPAEYSGLRKLLRK